MSADRHDLYCRKPQQYFLKCRRHDVYILSFLIQYFQKNHLQKNIEAVPTALILNLAGSFAIEVVPNGTFNVQSEVYERFLVKSLMC